MTDFVGKQQPFSALLIRLRLEKAKSSASCKKHTITLVKRVPSPFYKRAISHIKKNQVGPEEKIWSV